MRQCTTPPIESSIHATNWPLRIVLMASPIAALMVFASLTMVHSAIAYESTPGTRSSHPRPPDVPIGPHYFLPVADELRFCHSALQEKTMAAKAARRGVGGTSREGLTGATGLAT
jgi:hypothetical protein